MYVDQSGEFVLGSWGLKGSLVCLVHLQHTQTSYTGTAEIKTLRKKRYNLF